MFIFRKEEVVVAVVIEECQGNESNSGVRDARRVSFFRGFGGAEKLFMEKKSRGLMCQGKERMSVSQYE